MTTQYDIDQPSIPVKIPDAKGVVTIERWTSWRPMLVVNTTPATKLRFRTYAVPATDGMTIPVRLKTTLAGNLKVSVLGERVLRVRQIPFEFMWAAYSVMLLTISGIGVITGVIAFGLLYVNLTAVRSPTLPRAVKWGLAIWTLLSGFVVSYVILVAVDSAFQRAINGG